MFEGNMEDNRGFTKEAGIKEELQDLEADVPGFDSATKNDDKITDEAVLDHCKASQITSDHTQSLRDGEFHRNRLVDLL